MHRKLYTYICRLLLFNCNVSRFSVCACSTVNVCIRGVLAHDDHWSMCFVVCPLNVTNHCQKTWCPWMTIPWPTIVMVQMHSQCHLLGSPLYTYLCR